MHQPTPIRPGLLISLSTSVKPRHADAIKSTRELIESRTLPDGSLYERWKKTKTILDPKEWKRAGQARLRVRALVKAACAQTAFGFICPAEEQEQLDANLRQADREVAEFNRTSQHYEVRWQYLAGEIKADDAEAVRAIREQVGGILEDLESATKAGDVESIRDLCGQAQQMERLLEQKSTARGQVGRAVEAGRKIARAVVKQVQKAGEKIEGVLTEEQRSPISLARFAFVQRVDLDDEPQEDKT